MFAESYNCIYYVENENRPLLLKRNGDNFIISGLSKSENEIIYENNDVIIFGGVGVWDVGIGYRTTIIDKNLKMFSMDILFEPTIEYNSYISGNCIVN